MRVILVLFIIFGLIGCNAGNVKRSISTNGNITEISVLPEVDVIAVFEITEGNITSVKLGANDDKSQSTITFSFSGVGNSGMMLHSQSKLDVIVKYDVEMIDYRGKRHYTSSCPLMPGSGVFESWGHQIPELKISNFRVLDDSPAMSCE